MRLGFFRCQSTLVRQNITREKFRECMSKIANQAMVLSAASKSVVPHKSFRGLTISSLTSLSLKPQPLIQFNLQLPSFTSEALHETGFFAVHLLKPNTTSIKLAREFSKGAIINEKDRTYSPTRPFENLVENEHYVTYKIEGTDLVLPLLKNSERVLICQKKDVFQIGDHEIWVGQIEDIIVNEAQPTGGLLYCNRKYHSLGEKIG
ncbi:hypothetical protein HG536_0G01560 [Torulaspora globosa]|uniref:Flavin reductase like domain-containing protein n=1 Tax=Torulaspora globosa TaxID=48254 RepID=A0A7G3ZLB1_9SACH|nr:uncharacterized protein HG536_0G01560 [Torulaspora globosa]QLL34297.1 hypothetical protein HG536_0G01560 [Torulaspora globosa]